MDIRRLNLVPLFSTLTKRERRILARRADEVDVSPGTELIHEGDFVYEFFAIEDGRAEVVRDGEHIAFLGPGQIFGEMGFMAGRRTATVRAATPMRLIVMDRRSYSDVLRRMPDIANAISTIADQRAV